MRGSTFDPGDRTVSAGTTITWTNKDGVEHTVTGSGWGSQLLGQNATYTHTFDSTGSFPYHCTRHSGMTATITVQ
ncbi:MAG: plastocyanin [bacterium]|nr:plastocyanin [bacterium]